MRDDVVLLVNLVIAAWVATGSRVGDVPIRAVEIAFAEYFMAGAYRIESRWDCGRNVLTREDWFGGKWVFFLGRICGGMWKFFG